MNVFRALLLVALFGGMGGLGYALTSYGGFIKPQAVTKTVTVGSGANKTRHKVVMWSPGVIGDCLIGAITGVAVFAVYVNPTAVIARDTAVSMTMYGLGTILIAGLSGAAAINQMVKNKQWTQLAPVLAQVDPSGPKPATSASTPVQTLNLL